MRRTTSKHTTISMRGETYARLRDRIDREAAVRHHRGRRIGNVGQVVDDLIVIALDDPAIAAEIIARIAGAN